MQVKIKLRSKSNVCYYPHPPTQNPPHPKEPKKNQNSPRRRNSRGPTRLTTLFLMFLMFKATNQKKLFATFQDNPRRPLVLARGIDVKLQLPGRATSAWMSCSSKQRSFFVQSGCFRLIPFLAVCVDKNIF